MTMSDSKDEAVNRTGKRTNATRLDDFSCCQSVDVALITIGKEKAMNVSLVKIPATKPALAQPGTSIHMEEVLIPHAGGSVSVDHRMSLLISIRDIMRISCSVSMVYNGKTKLEEMRYS